MKIIALVFLTFLLSTSLAHAYTFGIGQTFGSDSYSGSRFPAQLVQVPLEGDNRKRFELKLQLDTYKDDFVTTQFFAVEPKIRVISEGEGSLLASFRYIPSTDSYRQTDFGIEIHYTVFQKPHSDLRESALIEEWELGLAIRRRSHTDDLTATRGIRTTPLSFYETVLALHSRFAHSDSNVVKPILLIRAQKSFYSEALTGFDRSGPMTDLYGVTPFVQGYLDFSLHTALSWNLGKAGGLTLEPKLFYTYGYFQETSRNAHVVGAHVQANAAGFGVFTGFELLKSDFRDWRNFLTLGATVSF